MKNLFAKALWLMAVLAFLGAPANSSGGSGKASFVIIVNPSNKMNAIGAAKLKFIFQRKISRWPWGAEIEPIDLPERTPVRVLFLKQILASDPERWAIYWIDEKVTGRANPPLQAANAAQAKAMVASIPGAIAYIPAAAVDRSVKVLEVQ